MTQHLTHRAPAARSIGVSAPLLPTPNAQPVQSQDITDRQTAIFGAFLRAVTAPPASTGPFISSSATCAQDVAADISYLSRGIAQSSYIPIPGGVNYPGYDLIGATTCENSVTGAIAAVKAVQRFRAANSIGDAEGRIEALIDTGRGVSQSFGGANYIGVRATSVATTLTGTPVVPSGGTPLGVAAYWFNFVGTLGFLLFYLGMGSWGAYNTYLDLKFRVALELAVRRDGPVGAAEFLQKRTHASAHEILAEHGHASDDRFKARLQKRALQELKTGFKRWQKEALPAERRLKDREINALFQEMLGHVASDFSVATRAQLLRDLHLSSSDPLVQGAALQPLHLIGLMHVTRDLQAKKLATFGRVTGGAAKAKVQKAVGMGLIERLNSTDPIVQASAAKKLKSVVATTRSANTRVMALSVMLLLAGVIGVPLCAMSVMTLGPVGMYVMFGLTIAVCLAMIAFDPIFLKDSWGGQPGRWDKTFILMGGLVMVAMLGLTVGLTLGFGLPLIPMYLCLGVGLLCLAMYAFAYAKVCIKGYRWKKNHPTLEQFRKKVQKKLQQNVSATCDAEMHSLFKKLPREDRARIKTAYHAFKPALRDPVLRELSSRADFVPLLLNSTFRPLLTEQELRVLNAVDPKLARRALKKTAKEMWTAFRVSNTAPALEQAMKIQKLRDRAQMAAFADWNVVLSEVMQDGALRQRLEWNLRYLLKRDESLLDLDAMMGQTDFAEFGDMLLADALARPNAQAVDTVLWQTAAELASKCSQAPTREAMLRHTCLEIFKAHRTPDAWSAVRGDPELYEHLKVNMWKRFAGQVDPDQLRARRAAEVRALFQQTLADIQHRHSA